MVNHDALNISLFERALSWLAAESRPEAMLEARRVFETGTGAIVDGAPDFEQRIAHFLEQQLCEGDPPPIARFALAHPELSEVERRELAGWLRSHRSLFVVLSHDGEDALLRDCLLGGTYLVRTPTHERGLTPGDRCDARIVALGSLLVLSPGRVYHPREAHSALDRLLAQLDFDAQSHTALLNALLLMRSRFLQFESVRAEHVYQAEALAPVRLRLR